MATLVITEYSELGVDSNGNVIPAGAVPPIASQNVVFTAGETDSAALNKATKFVELCSDTTCRIAWGAAPTAGATDGTRLPSDAVVYYPVAIGYQGAGTLKVSVISE